VNSSGVSQSILKKVTFSDRNNSTASSANLKGTALNEIVLKNFTGSGSNKFEFIDSTETAISVSLNNVHSTSGDMVKATAATTATVKGIGGSTNKVELDTGTLASLGIDGKADVELAGATASSVAVKVKGSDGIIKTDNGTITELKITSDTTANELSFNGSNTALEEITVEAASDADLKLDGDGAASIKLVDGSAVTAVSGVKLTFSNFTPSSGWTSSDGLKGGAGDDTFNLETGNYGAGVIAGGAGDDTFNVAAGSKVTLDGGAGDDVYDVALNTAGASTGTVASSNVVTISTTATNLANDKIKFPAASTAINAPSAVADEAAAIAWIEDVNNMTTADSLYLVTNSDNNVVYLVFNDSIAGLSAGDVIVKITNAPSNIGSATITADGTFTFV